MGIKVAINGYGRIGRQVVRAIFDYKLQDQLDIVAINASGSIETNAHLTKFDTVHGRFDADVSHDEKHLIIDGKKSLTSPPATQPNCHGANWGVDLVMECTGAFTSKEKAKIHLESGAKKVLISAPGGDDVDATIVYGVNDDVITDDMTVISNASCTTKLPGTCCQSVERKHRHCKRRDDHHPRADQRPNRNRRTPQRPAPCA